MIYKDHANTDEVERADALHHVHCAQPNLEIGGMTAPTTASNVLRAVTTSIWTVRAHSSRV